MRPLKRLDWRILATALLIAAPFVVYSNNYRHAYHLDDAYTLVANANVRTLNQLAVALDRAGKPNEARPLWEKVLRMADGYNDRATANTAHSHLNQKP
jgi:Flp pilus assembly protein TadD